MAQQTLSCTEENKLEKLLSDSRFQVTLKPVDTEVSQAQECIDAYIKGELKTCLEKMYSFNLLSEAKMKEDIKSWYLVINCVEQLKEVKELGTTLQKTLAKWYTHEDSLRTLIRSLPLSQQLGTMYQFFCSSLKFWKQNLKTQYEHVDELANSCNEIILQNSRRAQSAEEIEYLGQILEFLIITLHVETLKKRPALSMYTRFCELDDQLSQKLQSHSLAGHTTSIEKSILNVLQPPKVKKQQKNTASTKNMAVVTPATTSTPTTSRGTNDLQALEKEPKTLIPNDKHTMHLMHLRNLRRYMPSWIFAVSWSPQMILSLTFFLLAVVFPTVRRSKTFQIIWNNTSNKISLLIRLASTIINALASL